MRHPLLLSVLFLALAACGEDASPANTNSGGAGGTGGTAGEGGTGGTGGESPTFPLANVVWGTCPTPGGECTWIDVPLDWSNLEGETIPVFVRRYKTPAAERKGQLWLLEGGPGSAGWGYNEQVEVFQHLAPGFDLYLPDYRGVGYSSWLGCDYQEGGKFTRGCMDNLLKAWGDDLVHFDTSETVRDIAFAIDSTREEGDGVFLYGVSYGTFVLNRFLTLFPDKADAAVLDSVCPAEGCDVRMDRNFDQVAKFVFDSCGSDGFCSEKLGADPWATFAQVKADLAQGHCSAYLGYPNNAIVLDQITLLSVTDPHTVPLAMSALYRMRRCSAEDVAALDALLDWFSSPGGFDITADSSSEYLSLHVVFSEFWPDDLDRPKAEAELDELHLEMGTVRGWLEQKDVWNWPDSGVPAEHYRWAPTVSETPMLYLNGTLDGQTHVNGVRPVAETFRNDSQHYVEVPLAGHSVIYTSSWSQGLTCGMRIVEDFFAAPAGALDAGCADRVPALSFQGSPAMADRLYGTTDLWENGTGVGTAMRAMVSPVEERALETLRRNLQQPPRF